MDPVVMQRFQAIKNSRKSKKQLLLDRLFLYTFIPFTCSIFCSSPFWLPYLFSSMKDFLFISLPKLSSILSSPKLLFIVSNLIVVVLLGQSKYFASGSSLFGDVYYDEYVDRSRSFRNPSTMEAKKEMKMNPSERDVKMTCMVSATGRLVEEIREVKKQTSELEGEYELKKRADDFIARVNRQRRLEARLLLNQ